MRITQKQSKLLALLVLVVFFVVSWILSNSDQSSSNKSAKTSSLKTEELREHEQSQATEQFNGQADSAPENLEDKDPKFVLHKFHRSESKQGKKLWEVKARSGEYIPEKNAANVNDAVLWFYRDSGEVITLKATKAILEMTGSTLDHADLSEGVQLVYDNRVTLETQSAIFDKETETVTSSERVHITSDLIKINGTELQADLKTEEFTLLKDVDSVITPRKKKDTNEN